MSEDVSRSVPRPFELAQIDHVVLRVRDLAGMRAFYCDILGCTVEREQPALGLIQLRAGRSLVDLVSACGTLGRLRGAAPGSEGHNVDHVCLEIDRYDEASLRTYLRSKQVALGASGTRYGARGPGPSLYLSDPEGNGIELKGPPG